MPAHAQPSSPAPSEPETLRLGPFGGSWDVTGNLGKTLPQHSHSLYSRDTEAPRSWGLAPMSHGKSVKAESWSLGSGWAPCP